MAWKENHLHPGRLKVGTQGGRLSSTHSSTEEKAASVSVADEKRSTWPCGQMLPATQAEAPCHAFPTCLTTWSQPGTRRCNGRQPLPHHFALALLTLPGILHQCLGFHFCPHNPGLQDQLAYRAYLQHGSILEDVLFITHHAVLVQRGNPLLSILHNLGERVREVPLTV